MKTIKIIFGIGVALATLAVAALSTSCQNPVSGPNKGKSNGNVIIKIAGADSRTVLPAAPQFNRFELTLQKEGEEPQDIEDTSKITSSGVAVRLSEGDWTVTLKAYQNIAGNEVLAAQGSLSFTVNTEDKAKTIHIELKPFAIGESVEPGAFKYTVILPDGVNTAVFSLKNSDGTAVTGYDGLDLIADPTKLSGSIVLSAGYYDLSVILARQNGQSAGAFEVVHIYPGLESLLNLDLSTVEFANKVYIMGTLGGIRLGTVSITSDANGNNPIDGEVLSLDVLNRIEQSGTEAVRSANWAIAISSGHIGNAVWAVQKFAGVEGAKCIEKIESVPVNGKTGVVLDLQPATTPALVNVAPWYSKLSVNSGTNPIRAVDGVMTNYWDPHTSSPVWLELEYDFDVTVNASRVVFHAETEGASVLNGYTVEYWNNSDWQPLVEHKQHFLGSPNGSEKYSRFFTEETARKFRLNITDPAGQAPRVIGFELYKAADRAGLLSDITVAQDIYDSTFESVDGEDIEIGKKWITKQAKQDYQAAINAAWAVYDDPYKSETAINDARALLNAKRIIFINQRGDGNSGSLYVHGFSVQDGYKNKFVVKWQDEPEKTYELYISTTGTGNWTKLAVFNDPPGTGEPELKEYPVTQGITTQMTRFFKIVPVAVAGVPVDENKREEALSGACYTLGVPEVSFANTDPSYNTVSLKWTEAQEADVYRIEYTASGGDTNIEEKLASTLTFNGSHYIYSFKPVGHNDPAVSGKELTIRVEALNQALWDEVGGDKAEFSNLSTNSLSTRLVGPAELNASATQATSTNSIALSWSPVEGAAGYYVFRRQFNMNNTAQESAAIAYYVSNEQHSSLTVTGKDVAAGNGETTTTKASAGFASGRFTLTDSWMNDSEYNGDYSAYTAQYKNQQNDLARGNPYRYFIVPTLANQTLGSIGFAYINNNAATYTIQAGGETITYSNAGALEKTGFTFGFAQNVTATKGTYASSGNVNNGIQITWTPPPLLAGTGVTPQYTVWRKAYNETTWSYDPVSVTNASYNDNTVINPSTQKGIVYEYAIGINGSRPIDSSRFINDSRAQVDGKGVPKGYGYMLDMVKLQGVSRNEIKVGNEFGEDVTLLSGGVKNGGTDTNWGIDGYTVYVMNRNINGDWHIIADDVPAAASTSATQVVRVTTGMGTADGRDLLRVMRDYKHYFQVRSYVLNNGVKVYCPDPNWNYETLFVANRTNQETSDFLETEYVKWGARQISVEEFARIATLPIAWGIHHMRGGSRWNWVVHGYGTKTLNGNNGSSGQVSSEATYSASRWWWNFYNYKPSMDTRANKHPDGFQSGFYGAGDGGWNWQYAVIFLTINTGSRDGRSMIYAGAPSTSNFPDRYGARDNYGVDPFDIIGPPNVNGMYTGKMRFDNYQLNSSSETAGRMLVRYPASAAEVQGVGQYNVALPYVVFQGRDPAIRFEYDEWF